MSKYQIAFCGIKRSNKLNSTCAETPSTFFCQLLSIKWILDKRSTKIQTDLEQVQIVNKTFVPLQEENFLIGSVNIKCSRTDIHH